MNTMDKKIDEIDKKLEELKNNFVYLHDTLLYMNNSSESLKKIGIDQSCPCGLDLNPRKHMNQFETQKFKNCHYEDRCTHQVERAISKILKTYIEKGIDEALEEIQFHSNSAQLKFNTSKERGFKNCDEKCFANIIYTFNTLKNLVNQGIDNRTSQQNSLDISSPGDWINEYDTSSLYDVLAPISNPTRLKILKTLAKGSATFSQLERKSNIKANLQFHLNKLLNSKFVIKEKQHGKWRYFIHVNGLKALRYLIELKRILIN